MTIDSAHLLELVEAIAAGDVDPDAGMARHLAACPACAAALARARQVDRWLRLRPAPRAPEQFVAVVLARLRQDRWRSERYLDLGFNFAIAAGVALVVGGVWLLLNLSGLAAVMGDMSRLFGEGVGLLAERATRALPAYAGATALLIGGAAIWWWAERRVAP